MATSSAPIFPQAMVNFSAQILNASGTGLVVVATAGANGTKLESLIVTNTDTAAHDIQLWLTISSVNYLLGTIAIPLSSGNTNAAPAVDLLRSAQIPGLAFDANGNRYLYLASGTVLSAAALVAVAAAKTVNLFGQGGNY